MQFMCNGDPRRLPCAYLTLRYTHLQKPLLLQNYSRVMRKLGVRKHSQVIAFPYTGSLI